MSSLLEKGRKSGIQAHSYVISSVIGWNDEVLDGRRKTSVAKKIEKELVSSTRGALSQLAKYNATVERHTYDVFDV